MGPPPGSDGEHGAGGQTGCQTTLLQWGRRLVATERCMTQAEWTDWSPLQWGRRRVATESRPKRARLIRGHPCFNGAAAG